MAISQMYSQQLEQTFSQALGGVLNVPPVVGGVSQMLQQNIPGVFREAAMMVDSTITGVWDQNQAGAVCNYVIRAHAFTILQTMGVDGSMFVEAFKWVDGMRSRLNMQPQQQQQQQPQYAQPQYAQQQQPQYAQPQQRTFDPAALSASKFGTVNSSMVQPSSGVATINGVPASGCGGFSDDSDFSVPIEPVVPKVIPVVNNAFGAPDPMYSDTTITKPIKEEGNVERTTHEGSVPLPSHRDELQDFSNLIDPNQVAAIPEPKPADFKPFEYLDKAEVNINGMGGTDPMLEIYSSFPAAAHKPVLSKLTHRQSVPVSSTNGLLLDRLSSVEEITNVDECLLELRSISKTCLIPGLIRWVDGKLDMLVSGIMKHRYAMPPPSIASYIESRAMINRQLDSAGKLEDSNAIILNFLNEIMSGGSLSEVIAKDDNGNASGDKATFVEIGTTDYILTVPCNCLLNNADGSLWIEDFSDPTQVNVTLDAIFKNIGRLCPYIYIMDNGGTKFRIWRRNDGSPTPANYFVEQCDC